MISHTATSSFHNADEFKWKAYIILLFETVEFIDKLKFPEM